MYPYAAHQHNMMNPPLSAGHPQLAHAGGWPQAHAPHHHMQSQRLAIGHPSAMPYGHQQALMHRQALHGQDYDMPSCASHTMPADSFSAQHVHPTQYMQLQHAPSSAYLQGQLASHVPHSAPPQQQHFQQPSLQQMQYRQGLGAMSQPMFDAQTAAYINGQLSHPALGNMQGGSRMRMAEQHAEDVDIEQEINIKIKSRSKQAGNMQGKGQDQMFFGNHGHHPAGHSQQQAKQEADEAMSRFTYL